MEGRFSRAGFFFFRELAVWRVCFGVCGVVLVGLLEVVGGCLIGTYRSCCCCGLYIMILSMSMSSDLFDS